jgi:hypothetical protein
MTSTAKAKACETPTARQKRVWDKTAPGYDRQIGFFEKIWFAGGREWLGARARGRASTPSSPPEPAAPARGQQAEPWQDCQVSTNPGQLQHLVALGRVAFKETARLMQSLQMLGSSLASAPCPVGWLRPR